MIKINLVSEGRKPIVARKAKEALGVGDLPLGELLLYTFVLLGILMIAGYWWHLKGVIKDRDAAIAEAQREVDELALVLKEVEDFKVKKAELEHKIAVIERLKANQSGPVRIMDLVSAALPDLLWLDNMSLRGSSVDLRGQAFNTNQIATFLESLKRVPEFAEPRLKSAVKTPNQGVYSFDLGFTFSFAPSEEEGGEAAAAGG